MAENVTAQNIHANCIAAHGKGLLILGPSGAGKSALSLQLIAMGAQLVADDRCLIWAEGPVLMARAPSTTAGLIEARGIGILRLPARPSAAIAAVVDLGQTTTARMPPAQTTTLAGVTLEYLHFVPAPHFPSALMCYLMGQRHE